MSVFQHKTMSTNEVTLQSKNASKTKLKKVQKFSLETEDDNMSRKIMLNAFFPKQKSSFKFQRNIFRKFKKLLNKPKNTPLKTSLSIPSVTPHKIFGY